MSQPSLVVAAMAHAIHHLLVPVVRRPGREPDWDPRRDPSRDPSRDHGAISLEQVLWFVAAGVSVAVVAAILWNQIRDQANTPVDTPSAP